MYKFTKKVLSLTESELDLLLEELTYTELKEAYFIILEDSESINNLLSESIVTVQLNEMFDNLKRKIRTKAFEKKSKKEAAAAAKLMAAKSNPKTRDSKIKKLEKKANKAAIEKAEAGKKLIK